MDDPIINSSYEGGLSVLLSACAPPVSLDDDFGLGLDFLNDENEEKNDSLCGFDSLANSPMSHLTAVSFSSFCSQASLSLDCEPSDASLSPFLDDHLPSSLLGMPDPTMPASVVDEEAFSLGVTRPRKSLVVRKRTHNCSMACWLFRTLLTSEYQALPLIAIFELFENTNPSSAQRRHWRQSIRHCLMSSAMFVRVLTPNPRKDFLIMNEAGSWWTVHPETEEACADEVFRPGAAHRCPPNGIGEKIRDNARGKYKTNGKIYVRRRSLHNRLNVHSGPSTIASISLFSSKPSSPFKSSHTTMNAQRGDHLVVDHEEEVIDFNSLLPK